MKIVLWVFIVLLSFSYSAKATQTAGTPGYCLAIRGNGELAPAHWGGFAQIAERYGMPKAMAGGSSASISMFLFESIGLNPLLASNEYSEQQKNQILSLFVKSLQAYLETFLEHEQWKDTLRLVEDLKIEIGAHSADDFLIVVKRVLETNPDRFIRILLNHKVKIENTIKYAVELGLLNEDTFLPLYASMSQLLSSGTQSGLIRASMKLRFLLNEFIDSVQLLGKFNAETDANLFFRPGVLNFKRLAKTIGQVGNFYSAREMPQSLVRELRRFVLSCAPVASGRTWDEMRKQKPICDSQFKKLVGKYESLGLPKFEKSREQDLIGSRGKVFPTTAVMKGVAATEAKQRLAGYTTSLDSSYGAQFKSFDQNISFGYWGGQKDLASIAMNLRRPFADRNGAVWNFSHDEKSRRFLPLGQAPWFDALRTSPAEPGLAELQILQTKQDGEVVSAGGWSDLHPGAVLKAYGCENTIYLTRKGGESLFAQGVAKRLMELPEVPWSQISTNENVKKVNAIRNRQGIPGFVDSIWSRLYNLGNPMSSINQSLKVFDAVVCADWDRFNIETTGSVSAMIEESYRAPWAQSAFAKSRQTKSSSFPITITDVNNQFDKGLGYRPYAGCLPF